ncbi:MULTISPECIES: hypothetical protein [unclassified Nocardiopsis]|uniref:hypothetical protein n=1 Tax=Nocardiopsis TaxID=2013 RepID=UPI00387A8BC7
MTTIGPAFTDDVLFIAEQATRALAAETDALEQRLDELTAAEDHLIDIRATPEHHRFDGHRLRNLAEHVAEARTDLAKDTWHEYRSTTRAHAAWWADAAARAVLALGSGTPCAPARLLAADPGAHLDDDQAVHLSGPDDDEREKMLASRGISASGSGSALIYQDEYMKALGLRVVFEGTGLNRFDRELGIDMSVEGRRRVVWGEAWLLHTLPLLPGPDEVAQALSGRIPDDHLQSVERAAAEWEAMFHRVRRIPELRNRFARLIEQGRGDDPVGDEFVDAENERLNATPAIVAYATALTAAWRAATGLPGPEQALHRE